jgi:hypothetical protein
VLKRQVSVLDQACCNGQPKDEQTGLVDGKGMTWATRAGDALARAVNRGAALAGPAHVRSSRVRVHICACAHEGGGKGWPTSRLSSSLHPGCPRAAHATAACARSCSVAGCGASPSASTRSTAGGQPPAPPSAGLTIAAGRSNFSSAWVLLYRSPVGGPEPGSDGGKKTRAYGGEGGGVMYVPKVCVCVCGGVGSMCVCACS